MYYYWSIGITLVIFGILQYIDKQKNEKEYQLFKIKNGILLFMIYLMSTILCYFVFSDDNKTTVILESGTKSMNELDNLVNKSQIDPSILKKMSDNINIGFEPYEEQ